MTSNNRSHVFDHGDKSRARRRESFARGLALAREHGDLDLGVRLPSRSSRRRRELDEECTLREKKCSGDRSGDRPRRCRERDLEDESPRLCRERDLVSFGRVASHKAAGDGFSSTVCVLIEAGGDGLTDGAVAFGVAIHPVSSGTLPTGCTIACSANI